MSGPLDPYFLSNKLMFQNVCSHEILKDEGAYFLLYLVHALNSKMLFRNFVFLTNYAYLSVMFCILRPCVNPYACENCDLLIVFILSFPGELVDILNTTAF